MAKQVALNAQKQWCDNHLTGIKIWPRRGREALNVFVPIESWGVFVRFFELANIKLCWKKEYTVVTMPPH